MAPRVIVTVSQVGQKITGLTNHALDRIVERGVRPYEILEIIRDGRTKPGRKGAVRYISKSGEIRISELGVVVTAIRFKNPHAF